MSIKAMTWAFELPLEPRAKITLLAIADNARDDGVAWPSRDLIAQKSSQSRATVGRRLKILSDLGVLGLHERFREDGSRTTDEIRLDLSLTSDEVMRRMQSLNPDSKGESAEDAVDDAGTSESEGGYQIATPASHNSNPGDADVTPPPLHCSNPQDEPSVEPLTPPSPPPGGLGPMPKVDREANEKRDGLWKRFLAVYPGIAAMDQSAAKDELLKLSLEDAEWAVNAAPGYDGECRKLKKPPKNAHIWLRRGMFRNFPQEGSAATSATSFTRGSLEGRALINLHDALGVGEGFRKIYCHGDVVTYRKPMTEKVKAFASMPSRDRWVQLPTNRHGGGWNSISELSALPVRRRFNEGDAAPWYWPPDANGKLYTSATGPPETYMTEEDIEHI